LKKLFHASFLRRISGFAIFATLHETKMINYQIKDKISLDIYSNESFNVFVAHLMYSYIKLPF
jgi:hypothetical protein